MIILGMDGGLPTTWMGFVSIITIVGAFLGGVIAWFATRSERKSQSRAHAETNKVYEQTIAAQKGYTETIDQNYKSQLLTIVQTAEKLQTKLGTDLDTMTHERDGYRKKSHDLVGELNLIGLKIKEFEMRPDLTTLYHSEKQWHEQRETFYREMFRCQENMLELIRVLTDGQKEIITYIKEKNGVTV